jgi:hypothetical protein
MLTIDVIDDNASENWSTATMIEETRTAIRALNKTAQQAAADVRSDLPQRFTVRSPWTKKGIRFDRATTANPVSRVYSVDDYMFKQEGGEQYRPDGHVAIPSAVRSSPNALIPRNMLPNALRGRKDVFKFDFSKNSNHKPFPLVGIFQRVMNSKHFRVLYLLKDQKNTRPHWEFAPQVESAIDKYFERYYDEIDSMGSDEIVTRLTRTPYW